MAGVMARGKGTLLAYPKVLTAAERRGWGEPRMGRKTRMNGEKGAADHRHIRAFLLIRGYEDEDKKTARLPFLFYLQFPISNL